MMHMQRPELRTARQAGNRLARIQQAVRIECGLERMKLAQFRHGKLYAHLVDFLHTHTVFTGNRAAERDTQLQDFTAELFCALQIARLIGIIQNQRMQIAVAGMKYIRHSETKLFR